MYKHTHVYTKNRKKTILLLNYMQQKRRENKKNRKTLIRHYKILSYRRVPNCIEDDTSPIRIEFK